MRKYFLKIVALGGLAILFGALYVSTTQHATGIKEDDNASDVRTLQRATGINDNNVNDVRTIQHATGIKYNNANEEEASLKLIQRQLQQKKIDLEKRDVTERLNPKGGKSQNAPVDLVKVLPPEVRLGKKIQPTEYKDKKDQGSLTNNWDTKATKTTLTQTEGIIPRINSSRLTTNAVPLTVERVHQPLTVERVHHTPGRCYPLACIMSVHPLLIPFLG